MKVAVTGLSGIALDWAVTSIVAPDALLYGVGDWRESRCRGGAPGGEYPHRYGSSWTHAGPIIEREGIGFYRANASKWWAHPYGGDYSAEGPNALVAAMRCFVKSQLGEDIELPEELS